MSIDKPLDNCLEKGLLLWVVSLVKQIQDPGKNS